MCELDPEALDRAAQEPVRVIHPAGAFAEVANIFDAAIKREHAKQDRYRAKPHDDDPPPRAAA